MNVPKMSARLGAEFLGTFWLVFGGCGSAVIAAKFLSQPGSFSVGIGFLGVALAFGLTVLRMVYAVGHVSGGHFNPAVTVDMAVAKPFKWKDAPAYVVTQVVAGLVAGGLLELIAKGKPGFAATGNMAANGYGAHSPGGYSLTAALIAEIVLTGFFLYVILGATDTGAPEGFAPAAIGLCLTLIHLISIPIDNTSVNPARPVWRSSTATGRRVSSGASGWPRSSVRASPERRTPFSPGTAKAVTSPARHPPKTQVMASNSPKGG
jgi:aquaporin Z